MWQKCKIIVVWKIYKSKSMGGQLIKIWYVERNYLKKNKMYNKEIRDLSNLFLKIR